MIIIIIINLTDTGMKQSEEPTTASPVLLGIDPSASEDQLGNYSTMKANHVATRNNQRSTLVRLPHQTKRTSPAMAWLGKPTLNKYQSTIMVFKQDGGWWCAT